MLQQTQVTTVRALHTVGLFDPMEVPARGSKTLERVMERWSGLGYYSRARNLHRCAQAVVADHGGAFPRSAQVLQSLPGIGRSTAAAIAAFCFGERVAILDGNVKRVLARVAGWRGDLAVLREERGLWDLAQTLVPANPADMPAYTQGLMDLGATTCTARAPRCASCPLQDLCVAHREGEPTRYPVRTRKLKRSAQSLWLLHARRADGAVWLEKRPQQGVWAGLYCLPVFDDAHSLQAAVPARVPLDEIEPFVHVLTHNDLHLHPAQTSFGAGGPAGPGGWFGDSQWPALGLPAPVRKLLGVSGGSV